jgi:hypothetical protein
MATQARSRYFQLMQRAIEVLAQLPDPRLCDMNNEAVRADITMLLNEFNRIDAEMEEISRAVQCLH